MPEPLPQHPRHIALVKVSALGDVVHALPVANALKRAYPGARLTWIAQPVPRRLLEHHPAIDEFVMFQRRSGLPGLWSFVETGRALRSRRFDLLLDLQVALKAGVITGLARAPVKIGFDRERARELNWIFTTHRIPPRPVRHVQEDYLEFLEFLGIDPHPLQWGLTITDAERAQQRAYFDALGRPACGVVVGTSRRYKNWAPEHYARLLEALESDFGFRCVLLGGPSDVQRRAAASILHSTRACPVDALGDDVRRLLWTIAGSDLVIAPDTGPVHVAAALDVPVVGLYGYTNPKRWGPYGKFQELVADGYARSPGEEYPCSLEFRPEGMSRIRIDMVLEKVDLAVKSYLRPSGSRQLADARARGSQVGPAR